MQQLLERQTFSFSRAGEYFDARELQAQTGQPVGEFFAVILKELADNGLDAAEMAGVVPKLYIGVKLKGKSVRLYIRDNGTGIPASTVEKILDFTTRTSDKSAYRSPTRGCQGNALKTIVGIPHALGSKAPILVEAQGVRHIIRAWTDPAGEVQVDHKRQDIPSRPGTRWQLTLPAAGLDVAPMTWGMGFAIFNSHALVKINNIDRSEDTCKASSSGNGKSFKFYHSPTVIAGKSGRKFLPTDPTSAWWYDGKALARLVFQKIAASKAGGRDQALREFVREFSGLTSTRLAKAVCARLPHIKHLSDFEEQPGDTDKLLAAMHGLSKQWSDKQVVGKLGCVGAEHFRRSFARWYGLKKDGEKERFWYRQASLTVDGVPYIVEVAVADTKRDGGLFHGVNFSPTFGDALAGSHLTYEHAKGECSGFGLAGFLHSAHANPKNERPRTAVALHLIGPSFDFGDRGKSKILQLPGKVQELVADTLWHTVKTIYQEEERRKRDAAREEKREQVREDQEKPKDMPLTVAVPMVMKKAVAKASGGTRPVSAHTLYYVVRDMVQELTARPLRSGRFEQKLLTAYQRKHGAIPGLYYEPRGILYEPHTGEAIPLGTREVKAYQFPAWLFDKILYVEKKGLWPVLQDARLAEKYDMAVVAGEGFATEACRILFKRAESGKDYQLFVLHDADPAGYNICRTLREETERVPGHHVHVHDLGLTIQNALQMGLTPETFTRRKALPTKLQLAALERQYFEGRQVGSKSWICRRFELNSMTSPQLIEYTESGLQLAGVRGKVVPDDETLADQAADLLGHAMHAKIRDALVKLIDESGIIERVSETVRGKVSLDDARKWIEEAFAADRYESWDGALSSRLDDAVAEYRDDIEDEVKREVRGRLAGQ